MLLLFFSFGLLPSCATTTAPEKFRLEQFGPWPFRSLYQNQSGEGREEDGRLSRVDDDLMKVYAAELRGVGVDNNWDNPQIREAATRAFAARNQAFLNTLHDLLAAEKSSDHFLIKTQVEALRSELLSNSVTGVGHASRYDTSSIGYCFGRAAYAHLKLSKDGVPQRNMMKIFVFGRLRHAGEMWNYHVATFAAGWKENRRVWWAVDSLFPQPLELSEWMEQVRQFALLKGGRDFRFFATPPKKFLPAYGEYSLSQLSETEYQGYFEDLGRILLSPP